jgi:hypothetical protein
VSYHHPNFCNKQTGTATLLTTVLEQTQLEEHPHHLEGEFLIDNLQEVRQFGNIYLSNRIWCQHLDELEGII